MSDLQSGPQAERSRQLLIHCRVGLEVMQDRHGPEWFLFWSGTLVLLRSAIDVLQKKTGPMLAAQERWWAEIKGDQASHAIFWEFLKKDRDVLVHQGLSNAGQSVTISGAVFREGEDTLPSIYRYEYEMREGPFRGQDPRVVLQRAYSWVEEQLNRIEADAALHP